MIIDWQLTVAILLLTAFVGTAVVLLQLAWRLLRQMVRSRRPSFDDRDWIDNSRMAASPQLQVRIPPRLRSVEPPAPEGTRVPASAAAAPPTSEVLALKISIDTLTRRVANLEHKLASLPVPDGASAGSAVSDRPMPEEGPAMPRAMPLRLRSKNCPNV